MSKGKLTGIILAVVAVIGAITYSQLNKTQSQNNLSLDDFKAEEGSQPKAKNKTAEPHPFDLDDEDRPFANNEDSDSDKPGTPAGSEGLEGNGDDELAENEAIDKDFQDQINNAIETQIETDYKDFYTAANLDEGTKKKLADHYMDNKKKQQELIMMLMDENMSLEEIMDKQDLMANQQSKNLEKILNEDERLALADYNKKLPEKNLGKQVDTLLTGIEASDQELGQIKKVIMTEEQKDYQEGRSLNMIQSKHNLDFAGDHLKSLREIMLSSQKGDPSAIERNLRYEEERNRRINEQVPEKYRKALEEKQEESLNIQRSVVKMLKNKAD